MIWESREGSVQAHTHPITLIIKPGQFNVDKEYCDKILTKDKQLPDAPVFDHLSVHRSEKSHCKQMKQLSMGGTWNFTKSEKLLIHRIRQVIK